jgi:hypothetical protein
MTTAAIFEEEKLPVFLTKALVYSAQIFVLQ